MQLLYWSLIIAFCGAIGVLAYENSQDAQTFRLLEQTRTVSFSGMVGWIFVLGILTGWVILAMLQDLLRQVSEAE